MVDRHLGLYFHVPSSKFTNFPHVLAEVRHNENREVNRSFSLSRNKKDKLKTIHWKKLRNWDVIKKKK